MPDNNFTKKHLLEALKKAGLPFGYGVLIKYEKKGIVPKAQNTIKYGKKEIRTYTKAEIAIIVAKVKAYKKGSKKLSLSR